MSLVVNTHQAEAWNGYEGRHWADNQVRWDAAVGGFNGPLFDAAAIGEHDRVLDVGCGTGQTTRLAAVKARRGEAVGVDLSAPMLAMARATATADGVANVRFEQGDAQVHPFPAGGFDVAISRGGIMFFADPVAAFANIGRALRPGGRIAVMCMRHADRNEWVRVLTAMREHMPSLFEPGDPDGPGMFSLAEPPRIEAVFTGAGFDTVRMTPVDTRMRYGHDVDDATDLLFTSGPVHSNLAGLDEASVSRAREAIRTALRSHADPDGVHLRGAAWIVTATRR